MKKGDITRCYNYSDTSDHCKSCKCVDIDLVGAIQDVIDEDDRRISIGEYYLGKTWSLDDAHIKRIHNATGRYIEAIKAGIPFCAMSDYTEGRFRNEMLMPRPEWLQVAS